MPGAGFQLVLSSAQLREAYGVLKRMLSCSDPQRELLEHGTFWPCPLSRVGWRRRDDHACIGFLNAKGILCYPLRAALSPLCAVTAIHKGQSRARIGCVTCLNPECGTYIMTASGSLTCELPHLLQWLCFLILYWGNRNPGAWVSSEKVRSSYRFAVFSTI